MSFSSMTAELEDIAGTLEARGFKRLAARCDVITNTLERLDGANARLAAKKPPAKKAPTKKEEDEAPAKKRKADLGDNKGLSQGGSFKGPPPGSSDADEAGHSDQFIAENYHRTPVGNDSVSKMLGTPSVADMLSKLDFADEGRINIQASRRAADDSYDEGDPQDPFTTAGLPESGDEGAVPPVDKDQEGDVLPFLGTVEEGTLHMPQSASGSSSDVDRILSQAEQGTVKSTPGLMNRESSSARRILEARARRAAETETVNPDKLLNHSGDPQEDVMVNFPWVDGEAELDPVTASSDENETPGVYASRQVSRRSRRSAQ